MPFNKDRFNEAIANKKMTLQELATEIYNKSGQEITVDGLKYYKRKTSNSPSTKILSAIADVLDVSADFLLDKEETITSYFIPLIGKSSCGKPRDYDLNGYEPVPVPSKLFKQGMYAVEADGDSMSPKINHGEIVYCCPNQVIDNGKIVHYWLDGESGIKKYKINEAGTIISLIPINSSFDIITIHCEENHELIMAKVVGRFDDDF